MSLQTHEQVIAGSLAAASGGSFVTAHWFLVADQLLHFGAGLVSFITGITAIVFYVQGFMKKSDKHD